MELGSYFYQLHNYYFKGNFKEAFNPDGHSHTEETIIY